MSSCPSSPPPLQNTVVRKIVSDSGRIYTTFSINLGLLILGGLYYLYNAKSGVAEGQEEPAMAAVPISPNARAAANAAGPRPTGPPGP
jgi:hypothetical protein